jgi:hypothetical protein
MGIGQFSVLVAGLAFLAIFITGRKLSRGKGSRNATIMMAHKILSLAAVALLVLTATRVRAASGLGISDWASSAGSLALFVAAMTTGGLVSACAEGSRALRLAHRATSVVTALATALALYFLLVQI